MGCSNSKIVENSKNNQLALQGENDALLKRKEIYENIHLKFKNEVINKELMDDLLEFEKKKNANVTEHIEMMWRKHMQIIQNASINKNQFTKLILELVGENLTKTKFYYKEYDIFKIIQKKMNDNFVDLTNVEKKTVMDILANKEGYYLRAQKGIYYYLDFVYDEIQPYWKAIVENLLFNRDLNINIFSLILTPLLLSQEDVMKDIIKIIEFNQTITTINILISPASTDGKWLEHYNLNAKSYKFLFKIFEAIKNNKGIKVLFFNVTKNYKIILPPEISDLIIEKIKEDNLLGLHIGKFNFSEEFLLKLADSVTTLINLIYLGIDSNLNNSNSVNALRMGLLQNKSIEAILFAAIENPEFIDVLKTVLTENKKIKFFHFEKNLNIL